ncbi:MAG: DUF4389 domain-containing protein [candidate division WOR-3 bacterium]|nr:DUF4389 domain-containing protein [candidate division WOR-3 bacterium]
MDVPSDRHPVGLSVEYPDQKRNKLSVFFRIFAIIPIAVVLALLIGSGWHSEGTRRGVEYATAGFAVAPTLLMILFRRKYPRWWFDWNLNLNRFLFRVSAYGALLRDEYPSTDEEQALHLEVPYPDAKTELNRWLPLVKWFLVIPHLFVLVFIDLAAYVCVFIAWFAILFTGRYPRGLFDFVVGVMRWQARVVWYAVLFATDKYPPFSLEA